MNKNLKLILALVAMLCMIFAATAVAETTCEEHKWVTVSTLRAGTCTTAGIYKEQCSVCNETQYVNKFGHDFELDFVDATCEEPDLYGYVCTLCGETDGEMTVVEGSKALGHKYVDELIEADCVNAAGVKYTCTVCDDTYVDEFEGELAVAPLGHKEKAVEDIAATCSTKGWTGKVICEVCGEVLNKGTETAIAKDAHVAKAGTILKAPTCTANGVAKMECELCGEAMGYGTVDATCTWVDEIITPATCGKEGLKNRTCSVCGKKEEKVVITATGKHTFVEKLVEATCTTPDMYGEACAVCGTAKTELKVVEGSKELGHKYVEELVDAGCENAAGVKYTCTVCDDTYVDEFEGDLAEGALGHNFVISYVDSTCSTKGGWMITPCERCGKQVVESVYVELDPDNHTPKQDKILKAPTCDTNGIEKSVCAECGIDLGYKTIPATCTWVDEIITPATCGKDGLKNMTCSVCGDKQEKVVIPATGKHEYAEKFVDATCTTPDMYGEACVVCDAPKTELKVVEGSKALGHKFTEKLVEAGCENAAGVEYTCSVCDYTYIDEFEGELAVGALGHTESAVEDVAATCSTKGWAGKVVCADCGKVLDEGKETPIVKDAHIEGEPEVLKAPTCDANGIGKFTCKLCGAAMGYKTIDATCTWVDEIITPATCGKDGLKNRTCSVCGAKEEEIVIPANEDDHIFEETFLDADCENPDRYGDICTVCGAVDGELEYVEGSKELGHKYVEELVEAGCENAAGVKYTCSVCDDSYVDEFTGDLAVAALGHNFTVSYVDSTCSTKGGWMITPCERCGKQVVESVYVELDPDNHTAKQDKVLKAAGCETTGIAKMICAECGVDMGYQVIPAAHTLEDEIITPATCGKTGLKNQYCTVEDCDYKVEEVVIPATEKHTFVEDTKDATCTEPAKVGMICSVCGAAEGKLEVVGGSEALGHDWAETIVDAGCENAAGVQKVCKVCEAKEFEAFEGEMAVAPLGHKEKLVDVAATCGAKGEKDRIVCERCDKLIQKGTETEIDPDNHVDVLTKVLKEATCSTAGTATYVCELCDNVSYKAFYADHDWSEDQVDAKGTFIFRECAACGKIEILETIVEDDCDHAKFVEVAGTAATETKNGMTAGKKCADCGLVLYGCEVIPMITCECVAGEAVEENRVEATCTVDGSYDVVFYCTICGTEMARTTETIVAAGHVEEVVAGKDATCTEAGLTEGKKCSVCEEILVAQEEIPATGEKCVAGEAVEENRVEATCEADGSYEVVVYCTVCEAEMDRTTEIITAAGHVAGEAVEENRVEATCEADGSYEVVVYCTVCEAEMDRTTEIITAAGHKEETVAGKAATCTEAGLTDGVVCTVCNTVIEAQEEILALGHTVKTVAGKAATCTEAGLTDGEECTVCGAVLEEQKEIAAAGHKEETVAGKAATCTEAGKTEGTKCSVCGEILKAQEEIAAKGHSYKVTKYTYNEDYTEETTHYTCSGCGDTKTETNPF